MNLPSVLIKISHKIHDAGGHPLLVGGAVRDYLMTMDMNFRPKDFDIEVFNLSPLVLKDILSSFGSVKSCGESFGVLKVRIEDLDFDFSIPTTGIQEWKGSQGFHD